MDLCVEYGVECGSPIIELSQEGRGGGKQGQGRGIHY